MSLWFRLDTTFLHDLEVKGVALGPVIWPWVLAQLKRGDGVATPGELDAYLAARQLGLIEIFKEFRDELLRNPDLSIEAWLVDKIEAAMTQWREEAEGRDTPLLLSGRIERDVGGRRKSGPYGGNIQTRRGTSTRNWNRYSHSKITVLFERPPRPTGTDGSRSDTQPFPTVKKDEPAEDEEGQPSISGSRAKRLGSTIGEAWPRVDLLSRGVDGACLADTLIPKLHRYSDEQIAEAISAARTRKARHPNYVVTTLESWAEKGWLVDGRVERDRRRSKSSAAPSDREWSEWAKAQKRGS